MRLPATVPSTAAPTGATACSSCRRASAGSCVTGRPRTRGSSRTRTPTSAPRVPAPNWSISEGLLPMRRRQLDHFERAERHRLDLVQIVVVPPRIRRAGEADESIARLVDEEHPIALQRGEDDAGGAGEAPDGETRLQAHAGAHRGRVGIVGVPVVRGWVYPST